DSLTAARISSVLMLDCPPSPSGFCLPPEIWPTVFSHDASALSIGFVSEKAQGIPRPVGGFTDAPGGRSGLTWGPAAPLRFAQPALAQRVADDIGAALEFEFLHQVRLVRLDGLDADVEIGRDLL